MAALNPVLASALIVGGVGLVFAALIALANRKFYVFEDPRIDAVNEMLPGANCGACGFPGCRGFAEAAVRGDISPAGCTVMDEGARDDVASYLGVDAGDAVKRVARLLCAGGSDVAPFKARYAGIESCAAAVAVGGGGKGCVWGCVGLADCAVACTFDAISMNPRGLPVVDPEKCTACNACGRCVQDGAPGLIEIRSNLAVIDYAKIELQNPAATERCPTGAIQWVEWAQLDAERPQPVGSQA